MKRFCELLAGCNATKLLQAKACLVVTRTRAQEALQANFGRCAGFNRQQPVCLASSFQRTGLFFPRKTASPKIWTQTEVQLHGCPHFSTRDSPQLTAVRFSDCSELPRR